MYGGICELITLEAIGDISFYFGILKDFCSIINFYFVKDIYIIILTFTIANYF